MTDIVLTAEQLYAAAFAHFNAGQLSQATVFLEPLVSHPLVGPDALNLLAVVSAQQGDLSRSAAYLSRLVRAHPNNPEFRANQVTTLERAGDLPAAIEAANDWASALYTNKRWTEAEDALRRVLKLAPDHRPSRCNLAATCEALGRPTESIAIGLPLLRLYGESDAPTAELVGDIEAALPDSIRDPFVAIQRTFRSSQPPVGTHDLNELLPKALCNIGNSLTRVRQCELAIRAYRRSFALAPAPLTEWNLALALLLAGHFEEGWQAYESRWRWDGFEFPARGFPQPRWQGEPLEGRSILVYAEQGFGDTLHFCRFVPRLVERGARVTFEVQAPLYKLLRSSFAGTAIRLIQRADDPRTLTEPVEFDVHCGLMSLFHLLDLDMATLDVQKPYLVPSREAREFWRSALPAATRPRIGIVWAGRPEHYKDRERSITDPAVLGSLHEIAGLEWHSLQLGPAASMRSAFAGDCIDHTDALTDFDRTAALIECLDAVVTVDTAVAHLAGALGKPVFLMLAFAPDWRWQWDRTDSPWYPSLRLFRQPAPRDWNEPLAAVCRELKAMFAAGGPMTDGVMGSR